MKLKIFRSLYRMNAEFVKDSQAPQVVKVMEFSRSLHYHDGTEVRYGFGSTRDAMERYAGLQFSEVIFGDYLPEPEAMEYLRSLARTAPQPA